jgi:hypothetical protein
VHQDVRQLVRDWVETSRGTTVRRMSVTRSAYASSATLLNVHLTLAGGERLRVVYKLGDPNGQIPAARGVKPEVVYDAGREAWMYESVLAHDGFADAPRLLSSGRVRHGGHWLLMEWAGSVDLSQVGAREVWCQAASQLARMHVWGETRVGDLAHESLVRWDDPQVNMWWARRACRFQAEFCLMGGVTVDPLAPLWRRYRVVAQRLAGMPKTLVHGDFNASNVLVTPGPAGKRIRIIDWETAGIGPGLLDLASLISGRLPKGHRAAMVAAYRANLAGSSLSALSADEFDDALTWSRLALAVRWLGWSPGWSPPRAHAHDWRGEALILARRLELLDTA